MNKITDVIMKVVILFATFLTFYQFTQLPYISYGYTNLEFFRFQPMTNFTLVTFLVSINIRIITLNKVKYDFVRLCAELLIFNALIYLLFSLISYSKLSFYIVCVPLLLTILFYAFIDLRKTYTMSFHRSKSYSIILNRRALLIILIILSFTIPLFAYHQSNTSSNQILLIDNTFPDNKKRVELLEENRPDLEILYSEKYKQLTIIEKIEFFQKIELMEARLAGRPAQKVVIEQLVEDRLGYFSAIFHKIAISEELMNSNDGITVLEVILHEGRHATQFYLINALNDSNEIAIDLTYFTNINLLKDNYRDYIEYSSKHNNYYDYKMQAVEIDAQFHAITALIEYEEVFLIAESDVKVTQIP